MPVTDVTAAVARVRDDRVAGRHRRAVTHLGPNHVIEFDPNDDDRAVCSSYMYAQRYLEGSEGGDTSLVRPYTNHIRRTPDGGRIERVIQRARWSHGNQHARTEATTGYEGRPDG